MGLTCAWPIGAHLLLVVGPTFLLAGFVKGVIGLGLPTIAMALLAQAMTPAEAAALLLVPSFVTNIVQMATGPVLGPLIRRLWPMMLAIGGGTWLGSGIITGTHAGAASASLGAVLIVYAVFGLSSLRPAVPGWSEPWLGPTVGLTTGLVTGATGVFVIPAVPYLQALGLEKDELVQALGVSFTVSTVALAVSLAGGGAMDLADARLSLLALAPALLGMAVGGRVRSRISPALFRRCFFAGLLLLGLHLALRPLL